MKHLFYIVCFFISADFLLSCEKKEMMDYEGTDAVYFDVQYGAPWGDTTTWAHQYFMRVSFGNMQEGTEDTVIGLKVAVAGNVAGYDRPFRLEVDQDSTTASAEEYDLSGNDYVIHGGTNCSYVRMTLRKTPRMDDSTFNIRLRLLPNEHFATAFSEIGEIPGRWTDTDTTLYNNPDPNLFTVFVDNKIVQPAGWIEFQLGKFSRKKLELMMELTGWPKSYFDDNTKMLQGRYRILQSVMGKYLMEQYRKGREYWVIDEDGTMMWVSGNVVTWGNGTRPEDMV